MVDFRIGRHRLVTIGWLLTASLGLSRSLSKAFALSTSSLPSVPTTSSATANDVKRESESCPHYKWVIVGGGIHGVSIASRLVGSSGISTDQLLVIDEHPCLLHSWKERTSATGMKFLRSSSGFHLDVPAEGLRDFAGEYGTTKTAAASTKKPSKKAARKAKNQRNKGSNPHGVFVGSDYQRPALELFNEHCDQVVNKYGLDNSFFRGRVEAIVGNDRNSKAKVLIRSGTKDASEATTATISADNIVLAVGNDDPLYPEWANHLVSKDSSGNHKISHLLEIVSNDNNASNEGSKTNPSEQRNVVAIIGGGISAVHKALQLTSGEDSNIVVHIISRHPVREQQFDTHQDWMMTDELAKLSLEKGGKGWTDRLSKFRAVGGLAERREVIKRERVPGTVPTYMTRAKGGLEEKISQKRVHWHVAGVDSASCLEEDDTKSGRYHLELTDGSTVSGVDEIILATGLGKRPPGHSIIHLLAQEANLPLSPCGYPLVHESLEWKQPTDSSSSTSLLSNSKIFVSGGLAELELGPSARNIAGARMAAERIAKAN